MKALVTGASGFIGSFVVDELLARGFEVKCIIRKSSKIKWIDLNKIDVEIADFDDINSLSQAAKGVDYVFHVAGLNFAKKKEDYYKVNTLGTKKLLEAIYLANPNIKRFVYVSSQTASGPSKSYENPLREDSPMNPITEYGKSKKLAEDEVKSYSEKLNYTIIKPPAVFGPRDTAIYNLFKLMSYGLATHVGFDKKYISLIYIEDLARGIVEAALSENTINKAYFLTNSEFYNWDYISDVFKVQLNKTFYLKIKIPDSVVLLIGKINRLISKITKKQSTFDYDKAVDFTQTYWTCTAEKAKQDFGFEQKYPFDEAVKKTYLWYKENKWL